MSIEDRVIAEDIQNFLGESEIYKMLVLTILHHQS